MHEISNFGKWKQVDQVHEVILSYLVNIKSYTRASLKKKIMSGKVPALSKGTSATFPETKMKKGWGGGFL